MQNKLFVKNVQMFQWYNFFSPLKRYLLELYIDVFTTAILNLSFPSSRPTDIVLRSST